MTEPNSGGAPKFPDRLRLPLSFDAALLARDLRAAKPEDWIAHFVPQNYVGEWSVIPLRAKAGATHPIMMIYSDPSCRTFADTPFLAAFPYCQEVMASFACPLLAVRLMRLGPGATIKEHSDYDLDAENGVARLHVPMLTSSDVTFALNGRPVDMEAGSCWYLRLSDPHAVVNRGTRERIHLVLDVEVDGWLKALFAAATQEA